MIIQKRKILQKIVDLESDIEKLKKIRIELASNEFVSATLASSGGTKSYTRADIGKITEAIAQLEAEYKKYHKMLSSDTSSSVSKKIYQIWY